MSEVLSADKHDKMDETSNVHIVAISNDGIIIRDSKGLTEKGEEIKTTEYFLDVEDQHIEEGDLDAQYVTVENVCKENESEQYIAVDVDDSSEIILEDKEVILWNELCRICANGSDRFVPIFSDEGLEHDLCNKIQTYLPLEVTENDSLPHQLCYNCAATLLAWHDMFKGCLDAQQRLEEMQNKFHLKDQDYNDSANEEESIHVAPEVETDIEETKIHNKEMEDVQMEQIIDGTNSDRSRNMELEKNRKETNISSTYNHNITADACSMTVTNWTNSETKQIESNLTPLQSTNLNKISNISENENKSTLNSLKQGNKKVKRKIKILHESYGCDDCGRLFKFKDSLTRHLRIHRNERPFTCHMCGKQFRDSGGLCRHLKDVHARLKKFACEICGKNFASKATRDDHRRTHTGERPYVCDICGKTFKSKASLYTHSKIHTEDFPHSCLQCKKKFRRRQELLCHLSTHTGEKNFACEVCFRRFRLKNELKRHALVHSNEKPFACNFCDFRCRQRRYLNNHIKQKHSMLEMKN